MSVSNILIGLLALALMGSLYAINNYRKEVQDLRTELTIARSDLEIMRLERDAANQAHKQRMQAEKEINDVAAQRNQLLDSLPSGWGNAPLPDECVRMFHYDPSSAVGSDSATGGSDATD